jgi:hypothetical protein
VPSFVVVVVVVVVEFVTLSVVTVVVLDVEGVVDALGEPGTGAVLVVAEAIEPRHGKHTDTPFTVPGQVPELHEVVPLYPGTGVSAVVQVVPSH